VSGSTRQDARRTLTPAVLASALFMVACAAIAVTFVAARGGLQLPVAPGGSQVAIASPTTVPATTPAPSVPSPAPATAAPSPTAAPPSPTAAPTPLPTTAPTPAGTPDPLTALPGCAGHPGCYEYTVRRGDTLSGVASRYVISLATVKALNPELGPSLTIVIGEVIYLGRAPYLRLDPCPGGTDCYLYVVQPGDGLATIAARFGLSVQAILDANPQIPNANTIYSGQVIRLQYPLATA
jgi:hypothetical protein